MREVDFKHAFLFLDYYSVQEIENTKKFLRWMADDSLLDMLDKHRTVICLASALLVMGDLAQLLVELNSEEGVTIILVTHSLDLANRMTRVLKLVDGTLKNVTNSGVGD